jgi:type II secretory pathway pseudopilin PulG
VRRAPRGFTYLGLLLLIAIGGTALLAAGLLWSLEAQRERETELLFVGNEFREAIRRYHEANARSRDPYPKELEALLRDPQRPDTRRYLRRIYPDPVTGKARWGLVRTRSGGIMGVHSLSERRPVKQAGFEAANASFAGARRHADWRFVHGDESLAAPAAAPARPQPGGSGGGAVSAPASAPAPPPEAAPGDAAQAAAPAAAGDPRLPWNPCDKLRETHRTACATMRVRHGETAYRECLDSAAVRERECDANERYRHGLILR